MPRSFGEFSFFFAMTLVGVRYSTSNNGTRTLYDCKKESGKQLFPSGDLHLECPSSKDGCNGYRISAQKACAICCQKQWTAAKPGTRPLYDCKKESGKQLFPSGDLHLECPSSKDGCNGHRMSAQKACAICCQKQWTTTKPVITTLATVITTPKLTSGNTQVLPSDVTTNRLHTGTGSTSNFTCAELNADELKSSLISFALSSADAKFSVNPEPWIYFRVTNNCSVLTCILPAVIVPTVAVVVIAVVVIYWRKIRVFIVDLCKETRRGNDEENGGQHIPMVEARAENARNNDPNRLIQETYALRREENINYRISDGGRPVRPAT